MNIRFNYVNKRIDTIILNKLKAINNALAKSSKDVIEIKYTKCTRTNASSSIELDSNLDISQLDTSKSYVYILFDDNNISIYVGKSKSIKTRLTVHLIKN